MSTEDKGPESMLDRAISEIRSEALPPAAANEAAARVWARLSEAANAAPAAEIVSIRNCADFQALIPAYRDGTLSPARALLLTDHTHECPTCRRALAGTAQPVAMKARRGIPRVWQWAVAATLVGAAVITGSMMFNRYAVAPGPRATVGAVDGPLYRVAAGSYTSVGAGAPIDEMQTVRTGQGGHAFIRLRDGSMIEMRERTELAVSERREGVSIRLAAGNVIVQAAKQRPRHLFVATDDCLVSVTGTVFSVNHGIKGSRIAVVEGEVHVTQGSRTNVLHPGDQVSTRASLTPVPVREEIAWSQNAAEYSALLAEFARLGKRLEDMPGPGLRTSTRLLDVAPAGTAFYAAIPNLGPTLAETERIFREELAQSEPLRQWWAEKMQNGGEAKLNEVLARVQAFSAYLGPEIAVAVAPGTTGKVESPLVMAELSRPGFREFLAAQAGDQLPIRLVDDPRHVPAANQALYVYITGNLVFATPDAALLARAAAGSGEFKQTPFYARIAQSYAKGVAWLFAGDLETLVGRAKATANTAKLDSSGFGDAQFLVFERKDVSGRVENHAVLTFSQQRHGVASWLAAPAPMRSLDFISADATLATAAVVKNPAALLDEFLAMNGGPSSEAAQKLAEFQATTGVDIRQDLAQPLGGEFAFAMDGPMLPVPSWKLVLEVNDPARFQQTVEKLVVFGNHEAAQHSESRQLQIEKQQDGSRTFYAVRVTGTPFEAQYVYEGGFLIAAPSRDLVLRSLEYRTTGYSLARSAKFTSLLPQDGETSFSAVVYHSLGAALASAQSLPLPEQQRQTLDQIAAASAPSLILAYGRQDRIELASAGSFFGLRLQQLLSLGRGRLSGMQARPGGPVHQRF